MKKFLISALTCFFAISLAYAQIGDQPSPELGTVISGNGGRPPEHVFFPDCVETIPFTILVANLNLLPLNDDFCTGCDLSGYPAMGLSVNISEPGMSTYYPIPEGSFDFRYTTNTGVQIFGSTIWVPVDFSGACTNSEGLPFSTNWDATLLNALTMEAYDICAYMGTDDIFDCEVFDFGGCPDEITCDNNQYAQNSGSFNIDCGDCCEILSCEAECSEEQLNITTFCDFADDLPCDPCNGEISGNNLTLCITNENYVRLYDLELNASAAGWTVNGENQPIGTCITIPNFDPQQTYYICSIVTFWLPGGSTCEEAVCTTIGGCAEARSEPDVNTNIANPSFQVYPNPVKEALTLENEYNEQVSMQLISIDGKMLTESTIPSNGTKILMVQDLPAGLYHLQIRSATGEFLHAKRIVLTK